MGTQVVRQKLPRARHRDQRTWEDRLFLLAPASLRRAAMASLFRLSPRSRIRRLLLARVLIRGFATLRRKDWELLRRGYAEDVDYRIEGGTASGLPILGFDTDLNGFAPLVKMFEELYSAVDADFRVTELLDAGDWFAAVTVLEAHGRASGLDVSQRQVHLYRMRGGLIASQRTWFSWREGLEAVGLGHLADELERDER